MRIRSLLGVVLLLTACNNSDKFNPLGPGGGSGDAGTTDDNDDGGADKDAATLLDGPQLMVDVGVSAKGPMITITSPVGAGGTSPLVQYDTLNVTATVVTTSTFPLDASTVKILIPSTNGAGFISSNMILQPQANTFAGTIDISAIPTSTSQLSVVASDTAGETSIATVNYTHDRGPQITFVLPTAPTAKGSVNVEVQVFDPLAPLASVSGVVLSVGGKTITLTGTASGNTLIASGLVDFNSYDPPLDGEQIITVQATNGNNTVTRATKNFTVDNEGPVITPGTPMAGDFVGGVLHISCTLSDESDIDDSTVVAVIGGNVTNTVLLASAGSGIYTGLFDLKSLGTTFSFPAFSIRAADKLGNQSELAIEIIVDNSPPILAFDPPKLRTAITDPLLGIECSSHEIDPVGDDATNDGDKVFQVFTLRLRAEDQANHASGQTVVYPSLIDHTSVHLYASPVGTPLAVHTLQVGETQVPGAPCDSVNPTLVPTSNVMNGSNQAFSLLLTQMVPATSFDYTSLIQRPAVAPYGSDCDQFGEGTTPATPPEPICHVPEVSATMTGVLAYQDILTESEIWVIPPVSANNLGCAGIQFDSLNRLPEGPTCIVAVATDNAGNSNVSAPLRVCIDRGGGQCTSWPPSTLPDCTGTFDKQAGMVNTTTCAPAHFAASQVIFQQ